MLLRNGFIALDKRLLDKAPELWNSEICKKHYKQQSKNYNDNSTAHTLESRKEWPADNSAYKSTATQIYAVKKQGSYFRDKISTVNLSHHKYLCHCTYKEHKNATLDYPCFHRLTGFIHSNHHGNIDNQRCKEKNGHAEQAPVNFIELFPEAITFYKCNADFKYAVGQQNQ